jgi:hypothetical protein
MVLLFTPTYVRRISAGRALPVRRLFARPAPVCDARMWLLREEYS